MKSPLFACFLASTLLLPAETSEPEPLALKIASLRDQLAINSRELDPFGLPQNLNQAPLEDLLDKKSAASFPNLAHLRVQAIIGKSALLQGQVLDPGDRFRISQQNTSYTFEVVRIASNAITIRELRSKRLVTLAGPKAPSLPSHSDDTLELPSVPGLPEIDLP